MAIVTSQICGYLMEKDCAWFQIIDDVNSVVLNDIKNIADESVVLIKDRITKAISKDLYKVGSGNSTKDNLMQYALNYCTVNNLSESMTINFLANFTHFINNEFQEVVNELSSGKSKVGLILEIDTVGKNEGEFLKALNKNGVNILLISKDTSKVKFGEFLSKVKAFEFKTNERLNYTTKVERVEIKSNEEIKTVRNKLNITESDVYTGQIFEYIKDDRSLVEVSVIGISNINETKSQLDKIKDLQSRPDVITFIKNVDNEDYNNVPRVLMEMPDRNMRFLTMTIASHVVRKDKQLEEYIKNVIIAKMEEAEKQGKNLTTIKNKGIKELAWFNTFITDDTKTVVYIGEPSEKDIKKLTKISKIKEINKIFIDISGSEALSGLLENEIKQSEKCTMADLETETLSTMAYNASQRLNETLYDGNTLGLYRAGQITDCDTVHLKCTLDEVELYWSRTLDSRIGFENGKEKVKIPILFGVVHGVDKKYNERLGAFCSNKAIVYKARDLKQILNEDTHEFNVGSLFTSTDERLVRSEKADRYFIKRHKRYKYNMLLDSKQEYIFSKIDEMLNNRELERAVNNKHLVSSDGNPIKYKELLFGLALNFSSEIIEKINNFDFTSYSPNVVVVCENNDYLEAREVIYLKLLSCLGFDIMIFAPNKYKSVEEFLNPNEYELYTIGDSSSNFTMNSNIIENSKTKKKKWFGIF